MSFTFTPDSLTFADMQAGAVSEYQTVILTNTGDEDIFFTDYKLVGRFQVERSSIKRGLKAGKTQEVKIRAVPNQEGDLEGSLMLGTEEGKVILPLKVHAEGVYEAPPQTASVERAVEVPEPTDKSASAFKEGSILMKAMVLNEGDFYPDTDIPKVYLGIQYYKEADGSIPYELDPKRIYSMPDNSCLFWSLDISLVDFTSGSVVKFSCNDGIIMNSNSCLSVIKQHTTDVLINNSDLNNCNIILELDNTDSQIKFLLPVEFRNCTGGGTLKYALATQSQ